MRVHIAEVMPHLILDILLKYFFKIFMLRLEAPIKLTTSGRGKLTTCFAGEDSVVQVC
jgi:hypothetical protein